MKTLDYWAFNERGDINKVDMKIIEEPEQWLKKTLSNPYNFGVDNIIRSGIYRLHAIAYDMRPFLRKFVYKQHGSWYESYAINKTNLRKLVGGKIDQILEA